MFLFQREGTTQRRIRPVSAAVVRAARHIQCRLACGLIAEARDASRGSGEGRGPWRGGRWRRRRSGVGRHGRSVAGSGPGPRGRRGGARCGPLDSRTSARSGRRPPILSRPPAQISGRGRKYSLEIHTCDGVGRSVGELEVRAVRIVNFFCTVSRCRGRQLICQLLQVSSSLIVRNPPAKTARLVARRRAFWALETTCVRQRTQDRQSRTQS